MDQLSTEGVAQRVFVVVSEGPHSELVERLLLVRGISTRRFFRCEEALAYCKLKGAPRVLVVDCELPDCDLDRLLATARDRFPGMAVVGFSAVMSRAALQIARRAGAFDIVSSPRLDPSALSEAVERALDAATQRVSSRFPPPLERIGLTGSGAAMRHLGEDILRVAPTTSTVLITGETGTGKEIVARAIHQHSRRSEGPFVPVNCGGLSPSVLESELFGHVRGAFTGATTSRDGLFVSASGGTLFLDEIGEMPSRLQASLLRALQEGEVRSVGSDRARKVDARVVTATNRDLREMVEQGLFREDLFYRLNVLHLQVPALRDRREDIPSLSRSLVREHAAALGKEAPQILPDAMELLVGHDWPGNVRQLENVLERATILCRGAIDCASLALDDAPSAMKIRIAEREAGDVDGMPPLREARDEFERQYLSRLLDLTGGNRSDAARVAHLDPSNLRRLLKRHGLH